MDAFAPNFSISSFALSVAGLTEYIKAVLEENSTLRQVWVVGEVSSTKSHSSGLFFTLQDEAGTATINCVAWRSQLTKLANLPEIGAQITVLGSVRVYPQRSNYQLTVWQVLPTGDGLRALRYRQLRQQLTAEGLFDPERKRLLPRYPTALAVVTSPQAAAWGDIQRTLQQHHPGLPVIFSPATVQGDQAPASIVRALQRVAKDGRADVLLLSRGGGATEDLDCFNDERVVRAVAACPIPVITGIGHQRDESLADLAADVCAHTPTAAVAIAVPALETWLAEHQERLHQITLLMQETLYEADLKSGSLRQRLQRLRLDRQVHQEQTRLRQLKRRLAQAVQVRLRQAEDRCTALQEQLTTLDPESVLRRGYALVRAEGGEVVTQASALNTGQSLSIQLAQGRLTAQITAIEADDPGP
ncbi:exodeoxyribonuclease VII large subunit [Pseudanabaena sp. FACHB-2040]|uniref:exodeoxyribonuclease VII large subunit n=1 Tax=Pseudanabaena sp. FACHB-2040 TaxID=2692859 RepID=UPI001686F375|nr:exodeoxyribonuclease VII large subunit [Pseudanabaena sp. FACHB-2040]MBD2260109.1 exodeoxyribonuclease VII large subunit [Pseudanabaena sp. FACHB-2040]